MSGKPLLNSINRLLKRPHPATSKELRQFGLLLGVFLAVIVGLLFPWWSHLKFVLWPVLAGGIFILLALTAPITVAPLFYLWMAFAAVMGWINARIILTVIFYLMFFPLGFVMRLSGWDPLRRRMKEPQASYRIPSKRVDRKQMERPF